MSSGGSAGEVELEAFNPKGTLVLVALYLAIFAVVWIVGYVILLLERLHIRG